MESCDNHDGCIVVYEDPGRNAAKPYCPLCRLIDDHTELEQDQSLLKEKLADANNQIDDLIDELAKYNQVPFTHEDPEGRHFRV